MGPNHYLLQFFDFRHLPKPLQLVSAQFYDVAMGLDHGLPDGACKTNALQALLEAKDWAVRGAVADGALEKPDANEPPISGD